MGVRRGGSRVTSRDEAQAPLKKRDRWPKVDKMTDGLGDHKQIYMQSSLDNAGSQGNGGHTRSEGSPHLQGDG